MKTILNPWKSPKWGSGRDYNPPNEPVFKYGEYAIYELYNSWLYVYRDCAFNELAGLNKQHLMDVADRKGSGFLYNRAIENLTVTL